ncbi:MAG: hypothetical protein JSS61_01870 [Verrucomicrobia bacterium]|nr:hypothetical protein [Verrucomicrobiota bacterium]
MTQPISGQPPSGQGPISQTGGSTPPPMDSTSPLDPTGVWKEFLGPTATAEEVSRFINQMMQGINHQIEKDQKKFKETAQKLKRSFEGED